MAKGQKDAVIEFVMACVPTFVKGQDIALSVLSKDNIESIKAMVYNGLLNGDISYTKDRSNLPEVGTYARSMVMNHLKKARELNGGVLQKKGEAIHSNKSKRKTLHSDLQASVADEMEKTQVAGLRLELLSDELKEYVKKL